MFVCCFVYTLLFSFSTLSLSLSLRRRCCLALARKFHSNAAKETTASETNAIASERAAHTIHCDARAHLSSELHENTQLASYTYVESASDYCLFISGHNYEHNNSFRAYMSVLLFVVVAVA